MVRKYFWAAFLVLSFFSFKAANTRYWIGGTSTAWNNNANWGNASGSGAPQSYPVAGDIAIFDGGSSVNCTLTAAVNVATLSVTTGYIGTITQGANAITITSSSVWSGGTFAGGNATITNSGTFTLSGTNFTSTSGTLAISNTFSFTSGTFNHNNGTVTFGTNTFSISGSPTFNNISFVPSYNTLTFNNSFTVQGNFTMNTSAAWIITTLSTGVIITVNGNLSIAGSNQATINSGTIDVKGDITITNTSNSTVSTGTISISGTGSQTLTGSGTFGVGCIPNVIINKSSGALTLASYITVVGSWAYTAGTLNAGTSTVCFYNTGVPFSISGTHTLNNVDFYGSYNTYTISNDLTANNVTLDATFRCDVIVNSSLTINGTLLMTGSGYFKLSTGTVNVKGDITNNNTNTSGSGGGTASFIINGTGNQLFTGTTVTDLGLIPPCTINKPSGTLTLANYISFFHGLTYTAGTVNPGTSTCVFNDVAAIGSQSISASGMNFYNIVFAQPDYEWTKLLTDISVLGNLTIRASCGLQTNNHNISVGGNFTCLNTTAGGSGYAFIPGTGTVTFNGNNNAVTQTITSNNPNSSANLATFYNVVLNNTAERSTYDDITLADIMTVTNSTTFSNGTMLTNSSDYLRLNNGATSDIGNTGSYVNGPMRCLKSASGSTTFNLPIGKSGDYRPAVLTVNHNGAATYNYTAELFNANPWTVFGSGVNDMPSTVDTISGVHYWTIDRTNGTGVSQPTAGLNGTQQIQLYFGINDGVYEGSEITIVKNTSATPATWIDIGGTSTLGSFSSPQSGSITSTSSPATFSSFSSFTLGSRLSGWDPLPVNFLTFTAKPVNENVVLNWSTASETNNDHFDVERSADGNTYEYVTTVKAYGNGNSIVTQNYKAIDSKPYGGTSYYRLKQTDHNGNFKYSVIAPVTMGKIQPGFYIYPNPVQVQNATVVLTGMVNVKAELTVRNILGQIIVQKEITPSSNKYNYELSNENKLTPGTYFINVSFDGESISDKLLIE